MRRADTATSLVGLVAGLIVWVGGWALFIGLLWTISPSAALPFIIAAVVLTGLLVLRFLPAAK